MANAGFTIVYSVKPSRGVMSTRMLAAPEWMRGLKIEKVFSEPTKISRAIAADRPAVRAAREPKPGDDDTLFVVRSGDMKATQEALDRLAADPNIDFSYVAPPRALLNTKAALPAVDDWHTQVGLQDAKKLKQWKGKNRVTVGVVDSGIDPAHPQLSHMAYFEHHAKRSARPDPLAHGSHVAGLISAVFEGSNGFGGIADGLVDIEMHRGIAGNYDVAAYYRALRAACGSRLINLSLGGTAEDPFESRMIAAALKDEKIIVAAAGNEGEIGSPANYPAACSGVIAVGNVDRRGKRAASSNTNSYVLVSAPGELIVSTVPTYAVKDVKKMFNPPLAEMSGTSMATPIVTAIIARMLAYKPNLKRKQVIDFIEMTAKQKRNKQTGFGCINAHALLALL